MKTGIVALALALAAAHSASAADGSGFAGRAPETPIGRADPDPAYGTASLTVHQVGSFQFQPRSAAAPLSAAGAERYFTTASAFASATPMLPTGAQVERIELRGCDTDPAAQLQMDFGPCPVPGGSCAPGASVTTGTAAVPGCGNFSTTLAAPLVVDNQGQVLMISVTTGANTTPVRTSFSSVKIYYRLRVSPAPAAATFPNDVPVAHPFFRFVEALAAAGVTGGCGPGSYCPDSAVTRGQMAVFLATALGLHFPN